ncbi:peptidylprolyl isomerase [Acidobacterium sp. S8]|uniref:peptidylprolyl isomerase n=1 Tax=Acidobacterium sp. S8 TaxID=1641854 RepID=UPI00131D3BDF|nr:peptidylprolyl isomerase [Acidobacterium sp. S8]
MMRRIQIRRAWLLAAFGICLCGRVLAQAPANTAPPASGEQPIVLDRVIALVNGDVLLESDVHEEMRLVVLQPIIAPQGQNTKERAARRLITRNLMLRQMREQQQIKYAVTDDEVHKSLAELREDLPACKSAKCTTDEGWHAFLKANLLTEDEVEAYWRQRLEILKFINLRFGSSIRISRQDMQKYYQATIVPTFEKEKQKAPTLNSVAPRIQEILLQQQVNSMLHDWLENLREQGSVQILDPAYGQNSGSDDEGGE